jgi:mono/diheme cytochrome c family protein
MKRAVRWVGIGLGGIVVALALVVGVLLLVGNARLNKVYTIQVEQLVIPADAASIDNGRHIVSTVCEGCHADNMAGAPVLNAPGFAVINATNLTTGQGGVGNQYADDGWARAIRNGVDHDGKSLLLMPSPELYYLSDMDLRAAIAYLKSLPPVDHEVADPNLSIIVRILVATGAWHLDVASVINQSGPRPVAPPPGITPAYGEYLVHTRICRNCHGQNLAGGSNPDPTGPPVANITPGGDLGQWTEADFIKALRTGVTPQGKTLKPGMPWRIYGRLSDDELKAIWAYLQTVPAVTRPAP